MKDVLDAIIYFDELSKDQKTALQSTLSSDPELLRVFDRWQQLKGEIRSSLDSSIPDRDHLVLYALHQNKESYLTQEEMEVLEASSPAIQTALHKHPALPLIIDDIKKAQADFLQLWPDTAISQEQPSGTAKIYPLNSFNRLTQRISRIAAVFLVACLSLYGAYSIWQHQQIETIRSVDNTFRTYHFDDGSKVRLVGASELTFAKPGLLSSFDRQVKLAGQAFFDISPNEKPFTVESATALTEATGTQFSIDAQPNQTEVILTSGEITLQSRQVQDQLITLSPGQRSFVPLGKAPSLPEDILDMTNQLSWTGLFIYHYSPLPSVASHLGSHFDAHIAVDASLEEEQFKASFDPDTLSLDEALNTLSIAFDARIDTVDTDTGTYLLTPILSE